VHEGRYHQVRRMFAAVGNHVVALHRDRVGGLALPDDLEPGAYRVLGAAEIGRIFAPDV
jgi:16S rRNA pseudouridine516 synthase